MIRSGPASEQGMTLVEMLVGMVVAGIMLGALVGLFIGQSQLMGEQTSQRAARDASRMREAGADLVQAYSALVYQGPALAARIARGAA